MFQLKGSLKCGLLAVALLAALPAGSWATMLTSTQTRSGSGTLGGVPFATSNFIITSVGDTAARLGYSAGWFINNTSASIQIDGLGTLDILTPTRLFVNNSTQTVGFSRAGTTGADLFNGPSAAALSTWDMLTPIGPISGQGQLMQWLDTPINTTCGVLMFNDSFSATIFNAVPEPATLALHSLGGLGIIRRRR